MQSEILRAITSKHAQVRVNSCQLMWRQIRTLGLKHEKKAIASSAPGRRALEQRGWHCPERKLAKWQLRKSKNKHFILTAVICQNGILIFWHVNGLSEIKLASKRLYATLAIAENSIDCFWERLEDELVLSCKSSLQHLNFRWVFPKHRYPTKLG